MSLEPIPTSSSSSPLPPPSLSLSAHSLLYGCVELGGTTIKVALAIDTPTNVVYQHSIPTKTPKETLPLLVAFFSQLPQLTSLGIASFGPISLNPSASDYGSVTTTPKAAWRGTNVVDAFRPLNVPIGFNTDVNAAALGELRWGRHSVLEEVKEGGMCVYITVGTGIGAGVVVHGKGVSGALHPEAGHIPIKRHSEDAYKGLCPYHVDCLEGLSTANAVAARANVSIDKLPSLPDSHPTFRIAAYYLAILCCSYAMLLSPHVIVVGGGLFKRPFILREVRRQFVSLISGYLNAPLINDVDNYIVTSIFDAEGSKTSAGAVGALELARRVHEGDDTDARKGKHASKL